MWSKKEDTEKAKQYAFKEVELYRREMMLKVQEEINKARQALVDDWSKIEHEYHSAKEQKGIEIARLDALIEAKKAILQQDNNTCLFLQGIVENLSKMHIQHK
jgi:cell division septum initiation protein DivIVA